MTKQITGDWIQIGQFWYNTKTGQILPVIQGGALPATDDFTDSDTTDLLAHNAGWYYIQPETFSIDGNELKTDSGTLSPAAWDADTFDDDQYSEIVAVTLPVWQMCGVIVRGEPDGGTPASTPDTYYVWYGNSNDGTYLKKYVAGTPTTLGSSGGTLSGSDVIRLEASGTTITPKINGSIENPPGAQTDSSISSGNAGVAGQGTDNRQDDWEGGDLAVDEKLAPQTLQPKRNIPIRRLNL